jgi:Fur family transcriptional regulator, ferric uptake regulator
MLQREFKRKGYKLTGPRRQILEYMVKAGRHPDAKEIHAAVKPLLPGIGIATVYRNMDLLVRLGLVRHLPLNDNRLHYEIILAEDHHHHLICTGCGRLEEFANCTFDHLADEIEKATRFLIQKHDLKAYGLCPDCSCKTV